MNKLGELTEWIEEHLEGKKHDLEIVLGANSKMPFPDLVSRRVVETEILVYRIMLRKVRELQEGGTDERKAGTMVV